MARSAAIHLLDRAVEVTEPVIVPHVAVCLLDEAVEAAEPVAVPPMATAAWHVVPSSSSWTVRQRPRWHGRTTRGGIHLLDGVAATESSAVLLVEMPRAVPLSSSWMEQRRRRRPWPHPSRWCGMWCCRRAPG